MYLSSEVENLQISERKSGSYTYWASRSVSLPKRSIIHSKSEIVEKLGNPARLASAIQSFENLASKRTKPSLRGMALFLMVCLNC